MRCKVFHSNLETQLEKQFQSLSHDHHYMFVSLSLNFMEPFPRGSNHQTIFYLIEIHSFRFLIDMQTILDEFFFLKFFIHSLNSTPFKKWQKIRVNTIFNLLKNRADTISLFLKTSVGTIFYSLKVECALYFWFWNWLWWVKISKKVKIWKNAILRKSERSTKRLSKYWSCVFRHRHKVVDTKQLF